MSWSHHQRYKIMSVKKNKSKNSLNLAEQICKEIDKTTVMTHGFRFEFNGTPVLRLDTGKTFEIKPYESNYYSPGIYNIYQYSMIYETDTEFILCRYFGPAGDEWSNEPLKKLKKLFSKLA